MQFLKNVIASLLAAGILAGAISVGQFTGAHDLYLDVSISEERIGDIFVTSITAENNSRFGLDSLAFVSDSDGVPLVLAVQAGSIRDASWCSDLRGSWNGVLESSQRLRAVVVSAHGGVNSSEKGMFSGSYQAPGSGGLPERRRIEVRSADAASLARLRRTAVTVFVLVLALALVAAVIWLTQRLGPRLQAQ